MKHYVGSLGSVVIETSFLFQVKCLFRIVLCFLLFVEQKPKLVRAFTFSRILSFVMGGEGESKLGFSRLSVLKFLRLEHLFWDWRLSVFYTVLYEWTDFITFAIFETFFFNSSKFRVPAIGQKLKIPALKFLIKICNSL